jgi:uncharacterized membrane protein YccF (DUF307 family)
MATRAAAHHEAAHRPLCLRALWFVLVGWWLTLFTIVIAYVCVLTIVALPAAGAYGLCVTVIGIPVAIAMLDLLPAVVTLQRD